jgi:hypothetical protein
MEAGTVSRNARVLQHLNPHEGSALAHLRNPRIIKHLSNHPGSQNIVAFRSFRKAVFSATVSLTEGLIDNPFFFSSELCSVCYKYDWHIPEKDASVSQLVQEMEEREARKAVEMLQPVWTTGEDTHPLPAGSLFQLMSRPQCPICRLVLHLMSPFSIKNFLDWAISQPLSELHQHRYFLQFADNKIHVKISRAESSTFRNAGFIELLSSNLDRKPELRPEQYSVWESCKLSHSKWWNASWARSFDLNFSLVKTWLRHCDKHHVRCQELRTKKMHSIELRLIDVIEQKIVSASSNVRFYALSYVWGRVSILSTTAANLADLEEPGSLRSRSAQIPQTVRDAMQFVLSMGDRYLWVDSLCIVQDDNIEKHDQILQMHRIYSTAYATIVQHSGDDASSGLPGVRKDTRSMLATEAFPRGRAMIAVENFSVPGVLQESVHSTRGWTMQEVLVSNRCLHFFNKQLTFVCAEEYVQDWRSVDLNAASEDIHRTKLSKDVLWQMNPLAESTELDITGPHGFHAKWLRYFGIYARIMSDYTTRRLSYESDILHAFHGLSSALNRLGAGRFFYGLPSASFDHALLWLPASPMQRRQSTRETTLPSWSWAGWSGRSTYNCASSRGKASSLIYLNSYVTKFYIIEDGESLPVQRSAAEFLEDSINSPYLQTRRAAPPEPAQPREKTFHWPQGCLYFWAEEASMDQFHCRLSSASSETSTLEDRRSRRFTFLHLGYSNQRCGIISSSVDFLTDTTSPSGNSSPYSLVLMSESREWLNDWNAYQTQGLTYLHHQELFTGYPDSGGRRQFLNKCYCYFNVLLVKRVGLFVQRLGIGHIHPDAWLEVKRLRRCVRIV